ncbi:MAG: enoyl-CoA hydratase/isomerase family protein [Parvibaculaceae bacterium]
MPESLIVEREGRIVVATINRERARNALDDATLFALRDLLQETARQDVAAIVLAGAGLKAFSAGSDIKELAGQNREQRIGHTDLGQTVGDLIEQHPAAVIAAIEGFCLGGGLELAMACDYRIAGEGATLGLPEIHLNALPSWGGTVRLPRLVGVGRAREVIQFGRKLTPEEAVQWGLIHRAVPTGKALETARDFARDHVARTDRGIFAIVKGLVTHGIAAPPRTGRQLELLADMSVLSSDALEAGVSKFAGRA